MNKCPMCGAPLETVKCRYCGYVTEMQEKPQQVVREVVVHHYHPVSAPAPAPAPKPKPEPKPKKAPASRKSRFVALALCVTLGWTGAHRFYVGKYGTGILYLLSMGCYGFGWWIDALRLLFGRFYDKDGFQVRKWLG